MALDRLTKIDGGGISTTSDYRVGVITATKFVGPIEGTITSADATFTGNVSIAGTLTYEDVTNVDSVGVITARNGIKVSTGTATTALVVDGDARVTGILTVGTGSLTLNGPNNLVNVGTALTLGHTQGLQFHTQNLHSAGFEVNQINATGIITASSFRGDGSQLTGIDATALKDTGGNVKIQAQASGAVHTGIATFNNDIDVDGHTNLDNVSVAGVGTFTGNVGIAESIFHVGDTNTTIGFPANDHIKIHTGGVERFLITNSYNWLKNTTYVNTTNESNDNPIFLVRNNTQSYHTIWESQNTNARSTIFQWNDYGNSGTAGNLIFRSRNSPYEEHARFTGAGNFNLLKDLDVDGHTNLDNVSIAGVTTITGSGTNLALNVSSGYARVVGGQPSVVAHKSSSTFIHMGVENNANARAFLAYTNGKNFIIGRRNAYTGDNTGYSAADITVNNENAVTLSYDGSTKFTTTNTGAVVTGIMTATSFSGDGSNLTGLSGVSVANQSDNRLVTATGTTDALNAEANLTFDGSTLTLPAVSGANTNSALPVLFQTSSGAIEGGSGLTYNPGGDVLSVNGNHISRQTFRGDGSLGTLTCDNHSSTTAVAVSNTVDITTVDNTTNAFTLKQGTNEYITVDTNNSSELITLGNTTTDPTTKIISDKQILVLQGVDNSGSTDMKHGSESGGGESNSIYISKANSTFDFRGGMVMRGTGGTWALRVSGSGSMGTSSDTVGELFGVHPAEPNNPTHGQSTIANSVTDAYFRVMGNAKIFATVPIYQSGSRPFYFNSTAVTSNETITPSYNAMSVGNITINSGNSVTVQSGARWVIV